MFLAKSIQLILFTGLLVQFSATSPVAVANSNDNKVAATPIHLSLVERATAIPGFNKRSTEASIPLFNDIDSSQFGISVQIGNPPQPFVLVFDTGSTDTWVASPECRVDNGCPEFLKRYSSANSSTYHSTGKDGSEDDSEIVYSIGRVEGRYFEDVFALPAKLNNDIKGNNETNTVTPIAPLYKNDQQRLLLVNRAEGPLSHQHRKSGKTDVVLDGVFAAGLPTSVAAANNQETNEKGTQQLNTTSLSVGNKNSSMPFIISLFNSNIIPKPVFSVALNENSLILGDTHPSAGDYLYTDVASVSKHLSNQGNHSTPSLLRWDANVHRFQFQDGSRALNFHFNEPAAFGFDTGSNFLYLPEALAHELAAAVSHNTYKKPTEQNPYFLIDCEYQKTNQYISIFFQASSAMEQKVPTDEIFMKIPVKHLIAQRESDKQCVLLFVPSSSNFIIGNMILRHFYTVFDFGKQPRIGFASSFS